MKKIAIVIFIVLTSSIVFAMDPLQGTYIISPVSNFLYTYVEFNPDGILTLTSKNGTLKSEFSFHFVKKFSFVFLYIQSSIKGEIESRYQIIYLVNSEIVLLPTTESNQLTEIYLHPIN